MNQDDDLIVKPTTRITPDSNVSLIDTSMGDERSYLDNYDSYDSYIYGDADATVECRAARRKSRDPEVREAAFDWEARHPDYSDNPWLSDRCISLIQGGCDRVLAIQMGRVRDRVDLDRLRAVICPHE